MNEKPQTLKPFGRLCMTIGQLPASYVESMSYYEQLVWLTKFLQDEVIPVVNNNSEVTRELQEYIEHYFDNLDVQEEINNKLDEMAESGQLTDIIAQYLGLAGMITFNTVAEMKQAENIENGSKCATLGYSAVNDGGNGFYKIRNITNNDTVDEGSIIALHDENLIAELIFDKTITPEQVGAKGNDIDDDSEYLELAFTIAKNNNINLLLDKNYYINSSINLNGEDKTFDIIEKVGYLRIDGEITLHHLINSNIEFMLYSGGNDNEEEYGIIFENLNRCNLTLKAQEVNKTAFYIHTQSSPFTASKFCTCIVNGTGNKRTLLHGSEDSTHRGVAFGSYIDIEDTNYELPIRFINSTDISILHYENFINDTTYTKNSLEIIRANIKASLICAGGHCKNLIYIEDGKLYSDLLLLISEQSNASTSTELSCTGVYVKGSSLLSVNHISSTKLLYTIDAHEMTNQNLLRVGFTNIVYSTPLGRGIYVPDVCGTRLATNVDYEKDRARSITLTASNEHVTITNVRAEKMGNQIHISGYITIDQDIAYNTDLFTLGNDNNAVHISYGYLRQAANTIKMCQISQNTNNLKAINPLALTDGANLYIEMTYITTKI